MSKSKPHKNPLLVLNDLTVRFNTSEGEVTAVNNLNCELMQGEVLGIVGESGSGKSQSMFALLGLLANNGYATGSVYFLGQELLSLPEKQLNKIRGSQISMIFQNPMTALNPFLNIGTQLIELLTIHQQMSYSLAKQEVLMMLDAVKISEAKKRLKMYPHEFSGGMLQRVMIAMSLLCRPTLLIADEPTTALDVTIQAQILELLKALRTDFNLSIIMITHDFGVVASLCDRVLVMYAGNLVESATTKTILDNPIHPYTQGLLRSIPRINESTMNELEIIPGQPPNLSNLPSGCPFSPRCPHATLQCDVMPEITQRTSAHWARCCEQ